MRSLRVNVYRLVQFRKENFFRAHPEAHFVVSMPFSMRPSERVSKRMACKSE